MINDLIDTSRQYGPGTALPLAQIKTGAGYLMSLQALNVNAAARYLYLFDNTASSGALICAPILLAIGGNGAIDFAIPRKFSTGLRYAASSGAAGTFTASATDDLIVTAQYY